jgi:hypothetical protein
LSAPVSFMSSARACLYISGDRLSRRMRIVGCCSSWWCNAK